MTTQALKYRIRMLRLISRILATIISIAVLVPISLTLAKFLQTQNIYKEVNGVKRTAWSKTTKTWPTYMYFSIAASSFVLNFSSLIGYFRSVKTANLLSTMATWFSAIVLAANIIVWAVAAAIYRYEKGVVNDLGKHDDLWGWTCSGAAKAIQETFHEVPFDRYCNIQSAGWYAGLIQIGAMVLSAIIFALAWRRMKVKKQVRRSMSDRLTAHQYNAY
jgi:hypothetical protein